MNPLRTLRLNVLALTILLAAGCGDSTGSNQNRSGWLALSLATPNSDDGGILITVSGSPVDSVRSSHPYLFTQRDNASSLRVLIAGNLSAGVIGEILVPDTRQAAQYSTTIQEIAARDHRQRALSGYTLSLVPPAR